MTNTEARAVWDWATATHEEAARAGYIRPPWTPTDDACEFLEACYRIGMTPCQAAEAMFSTRQ